MDERAVVDATEEDDEGRGKPDALEASLVCDRKVSTPLAAGVATSLDSSARTARRNSASSPWLLLSLLLRRRWYDISRSVGAFVACAFAAVVIIGVGATLAA